MMEENDQPTSPKNRERHNSNRGFSSHHQDVNFPDNILEDVQPHRPSNRNSKASFSGDWSRARSHPVAKRNSVVPIDPTDIEPSYEIKSADLPKGKYNKSMKVVASRSLETVLGQKHKNEPLISRHMLFKEAIYTSIHMLGQPTQRFPSNKEDISVYSLVTFSSERNEQDAVLEHVRGEAFPLTVVNTLVKRAERVAGRKTNTLSDTYCFVGVETIDSTVVFQLDPSDWKTINIGSPKRPKRTSYPNKDHVRPLAEKRFNQLYAKLPPHVRTSIQIQTANPIWEQKFQSISLRPSIDTLTVEIWDHDDEKSVLRAIKNAKESKKARAVEEGMEELEDAFYQGKRDDFLGKATIQIQDIPVDGSERWYNLIGKSHRGEEAVGRILLQIWLTHAYRHGRHFEEYAEPKVMLERLWDYILDFESEKYGTDWNGDIPDAANCFLFQYGLQTGLSEATQAIIRWNVYAKHHLGLYGLGPRLTELDSVLNRIYQEETDHQRNEELETSMVILCIEKLCPIIRNHLHEPQERVIEAMKSIKHCRNILAKYKSHATIGRIDWLVDASLRISILEWYDAKYNDLVYSQHLKKQEELAAGVAAMMDKVNVLLGEGQTKWKTLFWMEGSVDYMPIVYDELQKMVIHDVETLAWSILQHFNNNDKLRIMLLRWYPLTNASANGWAVCESLFQLFAQTQIFVMTQDDIFEEGQISPYNELNDYHLWFRPVLVMWLGYTFIKSCEMTTKAINLDDVKPGDSYARISSSAVDTAVVFQQLASFWKELNWPDVPESYVVLHFILSMTCRIALLYTHLHKKKLKDQGYFDTEDRFDISDRLCTTFNNLEYVKEALLNVPIILKVEKLLNDLEIVLGQTTCKEYRQNVENTLYLTELQIEKLFKDILDGVRERVRPEIHTALEECLIMLNKGRETDETLHPLLSYVEDNLVVLDTSLLDLNFIRFLLMFWVLICEEICSVAKHFPLSTSAEQAHLFARVQSIFPPIMEYFKGGLMEEEMNVQQYKTTLKFLNMLCMDTNYLIGTYYTERARNQMVQNESKKYGTLTAHVSFRNGKLNVHVIHARNILPMDMARFFIFKMKPNSDPVVEIDILPETNFHYPQTLRTETKWKTLNPDFDERFVWNVTESQCRQENSTIRFTVKDYDVVSKNDFLGEAFVPLNQIPGIIDHGGLAQPMTLSLRVVDPDNLTIAALNSRQWDQHAVTFVTEQEARVIKIN